MHLLFLVASIGSVLNVLQKHLFLVVHFLLGDGLVLLLEELAVLVLLLQLLGLLLRLHTLQGMLQLILREILLVALQQLRCVGTLPARDEHLTLLELLALFKLVGILLLLLLLLVALRQNAHSLVIWLSLSEALIVLLNLPVGPHLCGILLHLAG